MFGSFRLERECPRACSNKKMVRLGESFFLLFSFVERVVKVGYLVASFIWASLLVEVKE